MPEQPHWSERTLDMPPQDPWADPPTAQVPPAAAAPPRSGPAAPVPPRSGPAGAAAPRSGPPSPPPAPTGADGQPFSRGRAQVNPHPRTREFTADHEPTGTGWPGAAAPEQRRPMSWHVRELKRGGEWSSAALLFAFVCWGIWAISTEGEGLTTPIIVFVLSLFVAAGLFALSRVIGRVVLEKQLHRVRRTARGSHIVAAVFLVGVGLAHLRQTEWVMDAYRWVAGVF
jgi:hypothetical protein